MGSASGGVEARTAALVSGLSLREEPPHSPLSNRSGISEFLTVFDLAVCAMTRPLRIAPCRRSHSELFHRTLTFARTEWPTLMRPASRKWTSEACIGTRSSADESPAPNRTRETITRRGEKEQSFMAGGQ